MGSARAAWRAPLTAMPAGHLRKGASSRGRSDRAARAGALARRRDRRARGGVFSWRRRGRSALRSELLGDRSGRNPRGQASKAAGSRLRRGVVQGWSTVYWGAWRRARGGPGRGRHLPLRRHRPAERARGTAHAGTWAPRTPKGSSARRQTPSRAGRGTVSTPAAWPGSLGLTPDPPTLGSLASEDTAATAVRIGRGSRV